MRTYTIAAGLRQRFLDLFEARTWPLQHSLGIAVAGPWVDLDHPDRFVWLRGFPSSEARETMKRDLYEGPEWTGELEGLMMPMLSDYQSILIELDDGAWQALCAAEQRP